jgi:AraC-like DNA-binding protein
MSLSDPAPEAEWMRSVTSPALDGLEMVEARFESRAFPLHAHDEYVIGAVLEGAKGSRHGARDLVADAGSLTLFNPYEEHTSAGFGAAWRFVGLYPTAAMLQAWFGPSTRRGGAPRFLSPLAKDPQGGQLVSGLLRVLSVPGSSLEAQSAFGALMSYFFDRYMAVGVTDAASAPPMHRARDLLRARLLDDVSLTELAILEQLSPASLLRGFRKAYGCTPRVYVTAQRIAEAKRRLKVGVSPARVAADLCFCDQGHFTRVFRRWTGMTPGAFANS